MLKQLELLYGCHAVAVEKELNKLIEHYKSITGSKQVKTSKLTQKESILITYGDSLIEEGKKPLETLNSFMKTYVGSSIEAIHILPFYPFTSDDGFSVLDYLEVNPELGNWSNIKALSHSYGLMFDAVINHISAKSKWYEGFLKGQDQYKDFFILCDPKLDYSLVTRPRALPLLTKARVNGEESYVWTTFSEDQIDLNYANPKVLLKVMEVLFEYMMKGAKYIRLDAIGFAWKEIGTSCIHLKETHALIQLIRESMTKVKEDIVIITETNVPHKENVSYFGNGHNEAHMVYQFPLPPLTLFTLLSGDASKILEWAKSLDDITSDTTYFNFLASHDGIGLRPVEGILTEDEIQLIVDTVGENNGMVNYKNNSDGTKSPYELNVNYMDALGVNQETEEMLCLKFMAAQGILYSMIGVPGIYIHSLLGSGNDLLGLQESGINRRINREKLHLSQIRQELDSETRRKKVFENNKRLLDIRRNEKAFDPYGKQVVNYLDKRLFTIDRVSLDGREMISVIINVSKEEIKSPIAGYDIISKKNIKMTTMISAYQVLWIKNSIV